MEMTDLVLIGLVAILTACYLSWRNNNEAKPPGPHKNISTAVALPTKRKSFLTSLIAKPKEPSAIIFYGSQTGTAEDFATRFAKELSEIYGVNCQICDFEDYDMEQLGEWPANSKGLACFFMATYGEGECTDNATDFYEWVMSGQGRGSDEAKEEDHMTEGKIFANISYVIFGLGNKTYEHFNAMGRRLDRRLTMCGAQRIGNIGEGDDDGSLEADYLCWKSKALDSVATYFGVAAIDKQSLPHIPLFTLKSIDIIDVICDRVYHGEMSAGIPRGWQKVFVKNVTHFSANLGIKADYCGAEEIYVESTLLETQSNDASHEKKSSIINLSKTGNTFDIKHPFYSRIVDSQSLFSECFDEFKFDINTCALPGKNKAYTVIDDTVKVIRQCYHFELDLQGSGLAYKTGDHVGIWADNDLSDVTRMANLLKIQLDNIFELEVNLDCKSSSSAKMPFSTPCSYKSALTHYLDLRASVKQYHFEILAKYANIDDETTALMKLANDRAHFVKTVEIPQKTLAEILEEFRSIKLPPVVAMTEILARNGLRYYSISSSSLKSPNVISITAVVVRYAIESPTVVQSLNEVALIKVITRQGLMTSHLQRLHESRCSNSQFEEIGSVIPKYYMPIYIRSSSFKLPDPSIPIIMVGPGTGIAPFRGFLWDRFTAAQNGIAVASTMFFFGCRHPDLDWLYRKEIEDMLEKTKEWRSNNKHYDLDVSTAFSRLPGQPKIYVQHRLLEKMEKVWDILHRQKGYFYVCGDAKNMATAVHETLEHIAVKSGVMDKEDGKKWVKELKASGRYLEDTW